jgi:uncharacterized protein
MTMARVEARGILGRFLAPQRRGVVFPHSCARAATLKHVIEAVGIPHTEVGRLTVNGCEATLSRIAREGDVVEVFPHEEGQAPFEDPLAFVADAHLGGLAHLLRMLGFDTLYDHSLHDAKIVETARAGRRVVLTRDRELLKRRDVLRGAFVHALKPEVQLREIASRYDIMARARPFTLCLHCNVLLEPADPARVLERVPERIRIRYRRFMYCGACDRVYWEGSHWERMRAVLAASLEVSAECLG